MTDWRDYWNNPSIVRNGDLLRQVGKTVSGEPISEACLDAIVEDIAGALRLNHDDLVLDLCCGNGLITHRCAKRCREIVGFDFSGPLIRVASTSFPGQNIRYVETDVCQLPEWFRQERFTKIYMYEALQHLSDAEMEKLLISLGESASAAAPAFFGSVPDKDRIWNFYDTPARREEYHRRVEEDTEAIGHWWTRSELAALARGCGYAVEFTAPNPALHVAHYRFDALLLRA